MKSIKKIPAAKIKDPVCKKYRPPLFPGSNSKLSLHDRVMVGKSLLPVKEVIQTAITKAFDTGRLKINADLTFSINGVPFRLASSTAECSTLSAEGELGNKFHYDGKKWILQFDGKTVVMADAIGLNYIKQLIQ